MDIAPRPAVESTAIVVRTRRASAATRSHFPGPIGSLAISRSLQNSAATSASDTVAQVRPTHEPPASCRRAISGRLVRLEVRPQPAGPLREEVRHPANVPVERGNVEDQSWRWYVTKVVDHQLVNR